MSSYLTSSTLIESVKREGMIPTSQSTFRPEDFLAIANQELKIGLVPSIMQYHQEYYVRDSATIPLVSNQSSYPIPYRAMGSKIRDVFYVDSSNNLRPLTRIFPDDRPYYQDSNFQNHYIYFYVQGNNIVLSPNVSQSPIGSLIVSYYMRPNELVDESKVATIESIAVTDTTGEITAISSGGPTAITSVAHGLSTGNFVTLTQTTSTPIVDGTWEITVVDADTFTINTTTLLAGTSGTWTYSTTTYTVDQIPSAFTSLPAMDFLQTNPGHQTYGFDQVPLAISGMDITFNTAQTLTDVLPPNIGVGPIVGDYIAVAGQCIIPQAPTDLHDVLSQRVVVRCLQALGDQTGFQMAMAKLAEMERWAGTLMDTRTEGSALKVNNLKGSLRNSTLRNRRWM